MEKNETLKIKEVELAATVFAGGKLISDDLPKIIFIGRSNVGKSSLINKIINRKNFAKTSSTPGKTVSINYYLINKEFYFVDLPGYGYARVSKKEVERIRDLISFFFEKVKNVRLVVILIDSRRGFMKPDIEILAKILNKEFRMLTVLTKSDKLKSSELVIQKNNLQKEYGLRVMTFSIKSKDNDEKREEILKKINQAIME
ncbi:MAG TPA: ribosome biogenesis GTP-binding protein YihA/YsxC [Candidatus Deferrimicrobium sp.]|nr:ribosome biogenesis GTP-binding protein YihA/YsxC [Candidatus Kapabacteria bacterium]HLP58243.1 ribosome biogenesis GTP-binding protein YihA/YsxC [Candidatus Deferrimicrobium sp.]